MVDHATTCEGCNNKGESLDVSLGANGIDVPQYFLKCAQKSSKMVKNRTPSKTPSF